MSPRSGERCTVSLGYLSGLVLLIVVGLLMMPAAKLDHVDMKIEDLFGSLGILARNGSFMICALSVSETAALGRYLILDGGHTINHALRV